MSAVCVAFAAAHASSSYPWTRWSGWRGFIPSTALIAVAPWMEPAREALPWEAGREFDGQPDSRTSNELAARIARGRLWGVQRWALAEWCLWHKSRDAKRASASGGMPARAADSFLCGLAASEKLGSAQAERWCRLEVASLIRAPTEWPADMPLYVALRPRASMLGVGPYLVRVTPDAPGLHAVEFLVMAGRRYFQHHGNGSEGYIDEWSERPSAAERRVLALGQIAEGTSTIALRVQIVGSVRDEDIRTDGGSGERRGRSGGKWSGYDGPFGPADRGAIQDAVVGQLVLAEATVSFKVAVRGRSADWLRPVTRQPRSAGGTPGPSMLLARSGERLRLEPPYYGVVGGERQRLRDLLDESDSPHVFEIQIQGRTVARTSADPRPGAPLHSSNDRAFVEGMPDGFELLLIRDEAIRSEPADSGRWSVRVMNQFGDELPAAIIVGGTLACLPAGLVFPLRVIDRAGPAR